MAMQIRQAWQCKAAHTRAALGARTDLDVCDDAAIERHAHVALPAAGQKRIVEK